MAIGDLDQSGFGRKNSPVKPQADPFGNLKVTEVLPRRAILSAAGKLYGIETGAGTAQAPKTAPVTTTAEWLLYNASPTDTMFLMAVGLFLKSGTLGLGMSLQVAAAIGTQTAVTSDYSGTIKTSLSGGTQTPPVYLGNNITVVGGTPAWIPVDATKHNSVATDSVGDGLMNWDLEGIFSAAPYGGIMCDTIGEVGTSALFSVFFVVAMLNVS